MLRIVVKAHWQSIPTQIGQAMLDNHLAQNISIAPTFATNWWRIQGDYITPCAINDPVWPINLIAKIDMLREQFPDTVWSIEFPAHTE